MSQIESKAIKNNAITGAKISDGTVANADLANMATQTIKGRTTAGTGAPEDLTATQATAILNEFVGDSGSGGTKGLVTVPAADDTNKNRFLKADGTWKRVNDPVIVGGFLEDFLAGGTSTASFNNSSTGTGASISNSGSGIEGNVWGVLGVATGTTTTGRGSGRGGIVSFSSTGRGFLIAQMRIAFTALSNGTDTYAFDVGFHDAYTVSTAPSEGIYFSYDSTSSANWIVNTTNSSTTTTTTTSTAVTTAYQTLEIRANAAWTSITFYINGALVATHTTNIPSGAVNLTTGVRMIKSAGTTSRSALMDYFNFQSVFSTTRG